MQVVQNADTESLEQGDVVEIAGMAPSLRKSGLPVIQVRKARESHTASVIGVVDSSYASQWLSLDIEEDPTGARAGRNRISLSHAGPVAPGEFMLIVVYGLCRVKASLGEEEIIPGQLLAVGNQPGYAMKAELAKGPDGKTISLPGSVFAKAIGRMEKTDNLIYAFVTLH